MNLDSYRKFYLIGIGGIGMSALARYFISKGGKVFGYDRNKSDLCIELESEGVDVYYNDNVTSIPNNILSSVDKTLVIYTPAISSDNQILSYFKIKKSSIFKRADILGIISRKSFTIAVSGTHGKTTTSTMISHILKKGNKNITAFLGGISRNYKTNFLLSEKEDFLILEADEYDKSFLQISPDIAIITSVSPDHLDIYKSENDLQMAFMQFASQVNQGGLLLVEKSIDLDFPTPKMGRKLTYSSEIKADYFAHNIRVKNGITVFDMIASYFDKDIKYNQDRKNLQSHMPGLHNVSNAIAASAVACYLGLSLHDIEEGLNTFLGIIRRFDKHIDNDKIVYIDDYAHHPEEVSATIDATKQLYPSRELIVVFQPHLFSRTKDFANEFALSLKGADDLLILDIYPAREEPIEGVNSKMLLDLCNNSRKEICTKDNLISVLEKKKIDILLTLGAGDISNLVRPIKHMLN
jgi:UDP-N-acetylmuramate--alanine ligase